MAAIIALQLLNFVDERFNNARDTKAVSITEKVFRSFG